MLSARVNLSSVCWQAFLLATDIVNVLNSHIVCQSCELPISRSHPVSMDIGRVDTG